MSPTIVKDMPGGAIDPRGARSRRPGRRLERPPRTPAWRRRPGTPSTARLSRMFEKTMGRDGIAGEVLTEPDALDHRIERRHRQREQRAGDPADLRADCERDDDGEVRQP